MFLKGIDELMRATFAARKTELENVVGNERTAADVCLTRMLEIKNIDKQIKNRSVKSEICVQTKRLTSNWKTVKPKATRARTEADDPFQRKKYENWIGRALQLKKIAKKQSADEVRNDPEGLALLQTLFSNEEVKTGEEDLLTKRIDAKTVLLKRHDEAIRQTRIKK